MDRLDLQVGPGEGRVRLDEYLAARIPALSRMRLRQMLDQGEVRVNGAVCPAGCRLAVGDAVTLALDPASITAMTPEPIPLLVYHEDTALIVVEKPAGMVVHPAGRHRSGTLANALAHHFNVVGRADPPIRPGLAHRLDRATSGLMVVAKTQAALSRLTVTFQRKQVEKGYLALVHGDPGAETGEWSAPIGQDPEAHPRWGIRPEGRAALTRFRRLAGRNDRTLLELEPVTGRTNQLRLHAAHFGCPIVGDELFGRGPEPGVTRLHLHAARLAFPHPANGEWVCFTSPAEFGL